jgi:hypothetical protein
MSAMRVDRDDKVVVLTNCDLVNVDELARLLVADLRRGARRIHRAHADKSVDRLWNMRESRHGRGQRRITERGGCFMRRTGENRACVLVDVVLVDGASLCVSPRGCGSLQHESARASNDIDLRGSDDD